MSKPKDKLNRLAGFKPPVIYPKYAWQVKTEKYFNFEAKFESIVLPDKLETTQKWITYPTRYTISFPLQTIRPKVQKLRIVEPFCMPKDVAVGRKRKQYAKIDFDQLLKDMKIEEIDLYPLQVIELIYPNAFKADNVFNLRYFLPLEWFDNNDLDVYNENDWLNLGIIDGKSNPLPALGFVPNLSYKNDDKILIENEAELLKIHFQIDPDDDVKATFQTNLYVWRLIAVYNYNEKIDRWLVTDLETYKSFYLHRLYFKFIAEDPVNYAKRLEQAIETRKQFQKIIHFESILDMLLFQMKFPRQNSIEKLIERIFLVAIPKKKIGIYYENKNFLEFLREQVRLEFNRHNSRYEFKKYLEKQDEFKYISTEFPKAKEIVKSYKLKRLLEDLENKMEELMFATLYYCPEVFFATQKICKECLYLETLTLFLCTAIKPISLEDFLSIQTYNVSKNVTHIKGFWVEDIADHVHILLRQTGKGWMDVYLRDWFIFHQSKIFPFLNQIQKRMEDSLQFFLENSIKCFIDMLCGPCVPTLNISDEYNWETTFKISPFESETHPPVFYIVINMCEDGACLSTNPKDFLPTLTNLFQSSLIQCTPIPLINLRVMINLVYAKNLYLDCGDHIEEMFYIKMELLMKSYKKAIIPLISYTHKYDQFRDLYYLIILDFIRELKAENKSANALKDIIINHKRLKQHLIHILPEKILIGPFSINTKPLKTFLVNKYQAIVDALLIYYTERMREFNETLLEALTLIFNKICEKVISIEHLYEIKDFIATVPSQLETLDERIKVMNYEYDILDYFLYNLSDEQFGMKWQVLAYPYRILKKIGETNEQHKIDIEIFKKIQINELAGYSDHLEGINEEVSQFGYVFDINKVEENAVDARKLWKLIIEMEKLGKLLRMRQEIFELEEYSLDFIMNIKASFQPYYDLWNSGLSVLKLEEVCIGNPMNSLDMMDIKAQFEGLKAMFESLIIVFAEKFEIQNIAKTFVERISGFDETIEVLDWLKNENWLLMHWQELSGKSKIEFKYSANISLQYCMKKGIMKHVELVRDIGTRAVEEADAIRQAFEEEERLKREEEERVYLKKMSRKCRRDIL